MNKTQLELLQKLYEEEGKYLHVVGSKWNEYVSSSKDVCIIDYKAEDEGTQLKVERQAWIRPSKQDNKILSIKMKLLNWIKEEDQQEGIIMRKTSFEVHSQDLKGKKLKQRRQ